MVPVHSLNGDVVMALDAQLTARAARASLAERLGVAASSLRLVRGLHVLSSDDPIAVASEQQQQHEEEGDERPLVVVRGRPPRFATVAWMRSSASCRPKTETRIWCSQSGECLVVLA